VSVAVELDAADAADVPLALVAVTVNVYVVAGASPETVIGEAPVPVIEPGEDVAVNALTAAPPLAPAVYATVADAFPPVAVPIVGACGTVVAVIELDADEAELVPAEDAAVTVNVYAVADCNPVTVIGELAPDAVYPPGELVTV
jgi:hypothetical protein